jgi:hypothetical protein
MSSEARQTCRSATEKMGEDDQSYEDGFPPHGFTNVLRMAAVLKTATRDCLDL